MNLSTLVSLHGPVVHYNPIQYKLKFSQLICNFQKKKSANFDLLFLFVFDFLS